MGGSSLEAKHNYIAILSVVIGVMVLLLPATIVTVPKGGSLVALLLLLSLFGLMITRSYPQLDLDERYFLYSFLLYFLIVALNVWWFGAELRELDTTSRFLLVLPVFLFLRNGMVSVRWLTAGIMIAAIVVGVVAIHDVYQLRIGRAQGAVDVGVFGLVAATAGLGCLSMLMTLKTGYWMKGLLIVGSVLAGVAVVLTLTRGVWIAVVIALSYLLIVNPISVDRKNRVVAAVVSVLFVSLVYAIPQTGVQSRIDQAVYEVTNYFGSATASNSGGARLEMWKAAYYVIGDNLVFGVGENNYKEHVDLLVRSERIDTFVGRFNHAHNEYLSTLVEQGVIGFVVLMLLFLLPMKGLLNVVRSCQGEIQGIALTGVLMTIVYMGFSLTSGVFDHQVGALFFAVMYAVIMGVVKGNSRALQ